MKKPALYSSTRKDLAEHKCVTAALSPPAKAETLVSRRAQFRALLGDWPISGPALNIGTKAYRDTEWQNVQKARLNTASNKLMAMLTDAGLGIVGGTPLFQLARHAAAPALFTHLAEAGILTRPFADQSDWLRFGTPGSDPDFDRLAAALSDWKPQ